MSAPDFLKKIQSLPAPNAVLQKVLHMLSQENSDWKHIGQVILQDPVLSGRVLQIANSTFYGTPRQVVDVEAACSMLGVMTLRGLVHTLVLMGQFRHEPNNSLLNYDALWRYCLQVACYLKIKAKQQKLDSNLAFTAGLFHCMDLILQDNLDQPSLSQRILIKGQGSSERIIEPLVKMLDMNEWQLIAQLLEHWRFPIQAIHIFTKHDDAISTSLIQLIETAWHIVDVNGFTEKDNDTDDAMKLYDELKQMLSV